MKIEQNAFASENNTLSERGSDAGEREDRSVGSGEGSSASDHLQAIHLMNLSLFTVTNDESLPGEFHSVASLMTVHRQRYLDEENEKRSSIDRNTLVKHGFMVYKTFPTHLPLLKVKSGFVDQISRGGWYRRRWSCQRFLSCHCQSVIQTRNGSISRKQSMPVALSQHDMRSRSFYLAGKIVSHSILHINVYCAGKRK